MQTRLIPCARVSSREQGDNGTSLADQVKACRAYIERIGAIALDPIIDDVTGITPITERPRGKAILHLIAQGKADGTVWLNVDRFYRDDLLGRLQVREWVRDGTEIHFTDSGQCLSDSDLSLVIKGWAGADERVKIITRTVNGRYATAARGAVMIGKYRPYGFTYISQSHAGRLEIYEPEAAVVRMIHRWYLTGPSPAEATDDYPAHIPLMMRQIAYLLHDKRIPTYGDTTPTHGRISGYADWQVGVVKGVLTNRVYVGEWAYGKRSKTRTPVPVAIPAIIDPATFALTQERVAQNAHYSTRNKRADYLLSGMVRCSCGARMYGRLASSKGANRPQYYVCGTRLLPHDYHPPCGAPYFRADAYDESVWQRFKNAILQPDKLIEGIQAMQATTSGANADTLASIATLERELKGLDDGDTRIISLYRRGIFDDTKLDAEKRIIDADRVRIADRLDALRLQLSTVVTTTQLDDFRVQCTAIAAGLDHATFDDRRTFMKLLDVIATLCGDKNGKHAQVTIAVNGLRVSVD